MICPECGSYQPDRAKFCGICGSPLAQDGLVESFLQKEGGEDIVLPRHRGFWFYAVVTLVVILSLAVFAGIGYVVYRLTWGGGKGERNGGRVEENTLQYTNSDIGFSLDYPDNWSLEEGYPAANELLSLKVYFSSSKYLEIRAYQLDPLVTIGGIESIKEFISSDAMERMRSLGWRPPAPLTPSAGGQAGYTETTPTEKAAGQEGAAGENGTGGGALTSSHVDSLPAFYTEFAANVMGEENRFLLYYIVADDFLFVLQGRAPATDYRGIRAQFIAIAGSFNWERGQEAAPPVTQETGT